MKIRMTIKPRDLQPGDLLPQIQDDFSTANVAIESVEAVRPHNATRYKVVLSGDAKPMYLHPNAEITIERESD